MSIGTDTQHIQLRHKGPHGSERLLTVPVKWLLLLLGAALTALTPARPLETGSAAIAGLVIYSLITLWVTWRFAIRDEGGQHERGALWVALLADVLFVTYLIALYGSVSSPLYLLYALLTVNIALNAVATSSILWLPLSFGPLYVATLAWRTQSLAFLADSLFIQRYLFLFALVLASILLGWLMHQRAQRILELETALEQQAQDLAQKTRILQRTASDLGDRVLELRNLQEVARALSSTLQLEETLQLIVNKLSQVSSFSRVAVGILDRDGTSLIGAMSAPSELQNLRRFRLHLGEDTAIRQALAELQPVIAGADEPRHSRIWNDTEYLVAPLVVRDHAIGALFLAPQPSANGRDIISERDQHLTSSFAYFAATAIENARLYQDVWEKSTELEAVLQAIGDAVVVTDIVGQLVMMNQVATTIFGLDEAPAPGSSLYTLFPGSPFLDLLADTLDADSDLFRDLVLTPEPDDRTRIYQALASPLRSASGEVRGVVTILRDVTAQKELERMKSNFLSVVSHELKTPLHSIKGFVEIILMGKTGPINDLQQDFLATVKEQTNHLQRLIDDLLEFSRLEAGQIRLRLEPVYLPEIGKRVVEKLSPLAETGKLHLSLRFDPEFPVIVADRLRMEQVLTNLVENALKFTPQGGQVSVSGSVHQEYVEVSVTDTGIGIPVTEQERVFDRFYQVESGADRGYTGTGLGLTICKHIIAYHRGRIWVESNPKGGSSFRFTLPRELQLDDEAPLDFTTLPERVR